MAIFRRENIALENLPKLDLSNEIINIFNKLLGLNSNEAIEKDFLEKYLGNLKKYSYHQIIIFIKLFISQFNKYKSKLCFVKDGKEITEKCLNYFTKSVTCCVDNGFQELILKEKIQKENKNNKELL